MSKSSEYGQTLSQLMAIKHYSIVVGIQVSNKTEYFLTEPIAKHYSGYILIPPGRIEPKHKEFMVNIFQFLLFISEYEEQLTYFFSKFIIWY